MKKDDDFARALSKAKSDLPAAIAERDEWNAKIAQLKQTIRVLGELCNEDPEEIEQWIGVDEGGRPSGITAAVRTALQWAKVANETPLSIPELRNLMTNRGFDFATQSNPIASLTTIVRRFRLNGDVEELTRGDGKKAYAWTRDVPIGTFTPERKPQRAHIPRGSFAEKFFAEDDAKKRKKE